MVTLGRLIWWVVDAGVPQGSILRPLLWNAFFNHLQLTLEALAYMDDCTLTFQCNTTDHHQTVALVNEVIQTISSKGGFSMILKQLLRVVIVRSVVT